MEIHFIWIEKYNSFNHKSVNLSARYVLEAILIDNNTLQLDIEHNPEFIENFFGKANVENVTAIIGKNGSGKSSVLEYIKQHFPQGLEANISNDLFVYSTNDAFGKKNIVLHASKYNLLLNDKTGLFKTERYEEFPGENNIKLINDLSNANYIYYSYILDQKDEIYNYHGISNISTTALLQQERARVFEEHRDEKTRMSVLTNASDLDYFFNSEMQKAMQFLISEHHTRLPFNRPGSLIVKLSKLDSYFFTNQKDKYPEAIKLLDDLILRKEEEGPDLAPLNNILITLLTNFLLMQEKFPQPIDIREQYRLFKEEAIKDFVLRLFTELGNEKFSFEEHNDVTVSRFVELSNFIPQFILIVESCLQLGSMKQGHEEGTYLFDISEQGYTDFQSLMNVYLRVKGLTSFLDFKWGGLSTGEHSFLMFMARFHHLRHHDTTDIPKNIVILIDEGDAGFHPEWQRKFFKEALDFLSGLFNTSQIQLIFTANTPFLTSDLPKSHVQFLEKKGLGDTVFHKKDNNREETFAANIHTLYSNSFYMNGVLMGEFAKGRIDQIIRYLKNNDDTVRRNDYKKTIDQIGEPILRSKLSEMWNIKFGIDEEIEQLQRRIDQLKKSKNSHNDQDTL